ncbi:hypothetical protein Leryth_010276 [Lithospermum erythrorhizon]|nr:hypothetical protein Leryth_010276 [Lithospermum erythrorhizon]
MRERDSPKNLSEDQKSSSESPPQHDGERIELGSTPQELDSSSSQSTMGGLETHYQSTSPKPDECCQKDIQGQPNPCILVGNQDSSINQLQLNMSQSSMSIPYVLYDPYYSGLITAYGPPVQQQMVGIGPGRVPLPIDLAEDGPIYVNSKQYHAILRRRQMRAKLEAQNKLIKSRKPYLHESRHQHAVKRVRGTGGRFLSTKKDQQSESTPSDSVHFHHQGEPSEVNAHRVEPPERDEPSVVRCRSSSKSNTDANFQQLDHRFSSMTPYMPFPGRTTHACNMEQRGAPVVR